MIHAAQNTIGAVQIQCCAVLRKEELSSGAKPIARTRY
jgi:hypothetical protein